jgi:hypothetical protein
LIDDALAVMTAIDTQLPDADGLKWFNRLYLRVTEGVRKAVAGPAFADPAFMTALDVVFANLSEGRRLIRDEEEEPLAEEVARHV